MLQKFKDLSESRWFLVTLALITVITAQTANVVFAVPNGNGTVTNNTVRGDSFAIRFGNTSVRHDNSRRVGDHNAIIPSGASFGRTADEARQLGDWTWIRGTLSGTAAQRTGWRPNGTNVTIGTSTNVWISTSQFGVRPDWGGTFPMSSGHVCRVNAGNTSVRHNPTLGLRGTAARLNNAGAHFHLTGDARIISGGFTWRLGILTPQGVQGRPWNWTTAATPDNGFTDTNYYNRMVWIATTQLTAVSGTAASHCN